MSLKLLKREIEKLPDVHKTVSDFKENWVKPVKSNTNKHLPFLKNLSDKQKKELNDKLSKSKKLFDEISTSQILKGKLQAYARYLIELKLTTLNGDENKAKYLTNHLLNDEFLSIKNTINDVQKFSSDVKELKIHHNEVGNYLEKHLTLEHALMFMELPHYMYLQNLLQTANDHKRIVRNISKNLILLAKESIKKKK